MLARLYATAPGIGEQIPFVATGFQPVTLPTSSEASAASATFAVPKLLASMGHGVGHDIDSQRIGILLRELAKILFILALTFPAVA